MNIDGNGERFKANWKIALVYDDRTRPETTGFYCRRALEKLTEVTFFHPSQLANVPRGAFDLYLNIDDGMRYLWPADLQPSTWWCIDTHIDFPWSLEKSRGFDFVFAAQRDGTTLLRREGVASARWLPLACDEVIHGGAERGRGGDAERGRRGDAERARRREGETERWSEGEKKYDVCFVGNLLPGPRTELVRLIQQYFKNVYVGQAYFEEMAAIYAASRVVFNRSVANDINMRVFEALASGSLLLTNDLADNGQAELFRDGVHLATYTDGHELLDKLRYYLRRDDVREKIAAAGRAEVLARHTYRHRMEELLRRVASRQWTVASGQQGWNAERASIRPHPGPLPEGEGNVGNPKSKTANPKSGDLSYFDFARPEVLELIPPTAQRVLEIGCGTGRLGEALKRRQSCKVIGVELDTLAAEKAAARLDRVIVGDGEQMDLDLVFESKIRNRKSKIAFDCLVCADVLEHLVDPASFLRGARPWLSDGAVVVASIPNVRHHSVVAALIEGNWTYEPAGLLDHTHLHFFTRRDTEALFAKAGYRIDKLQFMPGPGYDQWQKQQDKTQVQVGSVRLTDVPAEEAEEFFVYQFLVTARPNCAAVGAGLHHAERDGYGTADLKTSCGTDRPRPGPLPEGEGERRVPKCLLLMVTYNRLEYTRLALEAVLKLDYPNLQIVVWDNASADGTAEYLRNRLEGLPHVSLILSPANCGVVFPMNEVWSSDPEAELLAKIDNDTLVPPELLRRLADCHHKCKQFGALSGFHFRAEGEALAEEHRIKSFDGVRMLPQPYVGGCAVMIRREVFEKVGAIGCRSDAPNGKPFMDSGWTMYQQRLTQEGFVNGYPWPPVHVDHMEDTRSPYCIRSDAHQRYKHEERGMGLEEFTKELCVWRPSWEGENERGSEGETERGRDGGTEGQCKMQIAKCKMQNGASGQELDSEDRSPKTQDLRPKTSNCNPKSKIENPNSGMRFRQDFMRDFDEFDFWGKPFAFARFADGERAICMGTPVQGQDGWRFDGWQAGFAEQLNAALRYDAPGYYIGISDGCCDRPAKEWYLAQIRVPLERVTFSNIFVNANYRRFQQIDTGNMAVVASEGGDYWVPEDVMNSNFDLDHLVERLLAVDRPILISAGPASCIIIHKYWQRAVKRQVIVDVGSAIDERTKGRKTRQYQAPGTRTAGLRCTW